MTLENGNQRLSGGCRTLSENKIFDENKKELDREEKGRFREAWEVMYKKVMQQHATDDSDDENKVGEIKGSDWIQEHQLDVDAWDVFQLAN